MPIKCHVKVRYRFKKTAKGVKQRLAWCGKKLKEVVTFKKGRKIIRRK